MTAQSSPSPSTGEGGRCHAHPDQPALGACTRCGVFFCERDRRLVDDQPYCDTCAARPDVDYLERFRLEYWGKRDGWAWMVGINAVAYLIGGVFLLVAGGANMLTTALFWLVAGAVCACFWLGQPWARLGFVFIPLVFMGISLVKAEPMGLAFGVMPLLMSISIYNDTRNKLFFQVEMPRETLRKAWHLYKNNAVARAGLMLGVLGLFFPGVGLIALVCSGIGLRNVDPDAQPPIGRKGQAIAGLVLGAVGCLFWVWLGVYGFPRLG
ncbi:DUF4190 domain-containing protein [Archangium violaceum]|uniref:DUF4190 domain-containing protein n=1 Tax=Archangium violaceum TaxID=83451 RepID=UPI00194DFA97|nr:DUF4190 domain-containing protein [Archangium violaceum]QRN95042.1 DUF4190 domain-containing protein [Archangium violaceum]